MNKNKIYQYAGTAFFLLSLAACKSIDIQQRTENRTVPEKYASAENDTINTGKQNGTNISVILIFRI
jgi:hypothetical protein